MDILSDFKVFNRILSIQVSVMMIIIGVKSNEIHKTFTIW